MQTQSYPVVLTLGPSDPTTALGVQADLACIVSMGCYCATVITSVLIADTSRVEDALHIDSDWVADQARVVLEDMPVAAFKVGAVGTADNVTAIAEIMADYPDIPLILDPFLSSAANHGPEGEEVVHAMRELLVPQATIFLASAVELSRFASSWREGGSDAIEADAAHLIELGCQYVLVTGAQSTSVELSNILYGKEGAIRNDAWQRLPGTFSGAGGTISSAIAALLARGLDVPEAALEAQEFTHASLVHAHRLGMGKLTPNRFFWAQEATEDSERPDTKNES